VNHRPTALVADDEPLLRTELVALLQQAWPELQVLALARNGREAVAHFEALQPDICFLDVHMPGLSGVQAARAIGRRAHLVFVTAFDQYAVEAFAQGALDYLVKPVQPARLAETVQRLRERLQAAQPARNTEALLQQLSAQLQRASAAAAAPLRWIRASVGGKLRLIPVDEVDYLRADAKYTLVAWRGDGGQPGQALISLSLKELLAQLDTNQFAQVHRSVVVNLAAISHVTRGGNETADIHLTGRNEVLPVSRSYLHLFRQM
jgi:DNA-binding LytR/AlgR family response regulator